MKTPVPFWEGLCGVLARASTLAELGLGLAELVGPTTLAFERCEDGRWCTLWSDLAGNGRAVLPLGQWGRLRLGASAKGRLAPAAELIAAAAARLERANVSAAPTAGKATTLTRMMEAAHQRIDQQQTILDAVLNTAPFGVVLTDRQGNLTLYNRRFMTLFGFEGPLPAGMEMARLRRFFGDGRKFVRWLRNLPDEPDRTMTLDLRQSEPETRFLNLMTAPAYGANGQLMGRLFIVQDMTQQANVDLMKAELINVVSHELRTPLTSVLGFAELVLIRDLPTDKVRQYVSTIYAEGKRLSSLLDDFLDINRLESRQAPYHMRSVQLAPIIRKVATLFASDDRHPVEVIVPDALPPVRADADRLVQALSNLVSNAGKYSPDGGPIVIRVELQREQGRLVIRVQDRGLGIPESALGHLFSKFFRVHRPGHEGIGGTGLGLAIVHEIIKAHGGDIWVDSVEGEGSTFSFALPIRSRQPATRGGTAVLAGTAEADG